MLFGEEKQRRENKRSNSQNIKAASGHTGYLY